MKKKNQFLIAGGLIIIVVLLVIAKKQNWIGNDYSMKVSGEEISRADIIESVTTNGKIQAEKEVVITPDASGEIVGLEVEEGDRVEAQQLLLKINPDIYISNRDRAYASLNTAKANLANSKARLAQSKSSLIKAKANYNRNKKLYDDNVISESEFESIESNYEIAVADVEAAKQSVKAAEFSVKNAEASVKESEDNLVKTAVYSPFKGTVTRLSKELGERVAGASQFSMGTEVMRIADLKNMEVEVDVNENDIVRVELGDTALIEVDAYLGRKFKGVVTQIANSANTQGANLDQVTNFQVKIRILRSSYNDLIDEEKGEVSPFRSGMSASVEILTEYKDNTLAVPIRAVTTRADTTNNEEITDDEEKEYVFVFQDGKVELREVEIGIQNDQNFELLSGLKEGEMVITNPYNAVSKRLKDGDKVELVDKSKLFKTEDD